MGWSAFFDEGWESITHQEVSERNKFCTMLSIVDRENLRSVEIPLCLQCYSRYLTHFVLNSVSENNSDLFKFHHDIVLIYPLFENTGFKYMFVLFNAIFLLNF